MEKGYKILGNYIRLVDERNKNLAVTKLLGVSISKKFIPSIANIVGTDLSNYKIVRTGQFAYGPVTSRNGEKISIAYLDEEDCIISSSYTVFEVENKEELDPEYLMLWFSRPEFDRYARYKSHGSVREIFDWNELCMVELPVPDIEKQRKIVKAYKTITDRIDLKQKINDNLDATIYAKFQDMFQKNKEILFSGEQLEDWCIKPLSFLADFKYGKMATSEILCKKGFPVYSGYRTVGYCNKYMFKEPQLVVLARGVSGTGEVRISPPCCHLTNLSIAVLLYDRTYINYLLYYLENDNLISLDSGSAQSQITINDLSMHKVMLPPYSKVVEFDNIAKQLRSIIDENNKEIEVLEELKKVLLTTISSR